MSAPQTNIEKQKRWHRAPLIGMVVVVVFGVAMIFFWLMHESSQSGKVPEGVGAAVPTENTGKPATSP